MKAKMSRICKPKKLISSVERFDCEERKIGMIESKEKHTLCSKKLHFQINKITEIMRLLQNIRSVLVTTGLAPNSALLISDL